MPLRRFSCLGCSSYLGRPAGLIGCLALSLSLASGSALAASDASIDPGANPTSNDPGPKEPPFVEVEAIGGEAPPIREAVLRIQAELQAVGFGVKLTQGDPGAAGGASGTSVPACGMLISSGVVPR